MAKKKFIKFIRYNVISLLVEFSILNFIILSIYFITSDKFNIINLFEEVFFQIFYLKLLILVVIMSIIIGTILYKLENIIKIK